MKVNPLWMKIIIYTTMFVVIWVALTLIPKVGGYMWDRDFINFLNSSLFVLLVALTAELIDTNKTWFGPVLTALFLLMFCPGSDHFFTRDEVALMELSSQCIVPFFIGQYMRVSRKNFGWWYFLMLLMGIFCSYTHNGITIPLCLAFIWLSFTKRKMFFRRACWPMVVGFVIGTGLSIWKMRTQSLTMNTNLDAITSVTSIALRTLWDTKVFVIALALTIYMTLTARRRHILRYIGRRHYVLQFCLLFSLLTMPFAPLGIENAVTGVCFFSMFYVLFVCRYMAERYLKWKF